MKTISFEWDNQKDLANREKHGVSFHTAQTAFLDKHRVIAEDVEHSIDEKRYYCFGEVEGEILTVRFTYRHDIIRLIGADYWRKGKKMYEHAQKNKIHR